MTSTLQILILAIGALAVIAGWIWWSRRPRAEPQEPQFELEKLTNCKACGSLIPEEVRRCAFCGAWQTEHEAGE